MNYSARVQPTYHLAAWRDAARHGLRAQVEPQHIDWLGDDSGALLAAPDISSAPVTRDAPHVPKAFLPLAAAVLCHRDAQRHGLLYRVLWRMTHGERHLLETPTDADVRRLHALAQAVRRDSHKMKAFVRFREVPGQPNHFIAWFEPEHHIMERVAPFFAERFAAMHWAILTPERSAFWDRNALQFGEGGKPSDAPSDDAGEALWKTYYANIFNPARLNPKQMQQEMPKRYWKHLPEAALLPELISTAGARVVEMAQRQPQPPKRKIPGRKQ